MIDDELGWLDGLALAELVRQRQVTPLELVENAISRAEKANPQLQFIVEPMYDLARDSAASPSGEGPLHGVPMVLKDHLATHAGVRHTSGSRFLRDYTAPRDSELVGRFKRAGLVPIATTTSSEFALVATAEPERYGPCRNPWDPGRTTGGSSGGTAAAVAAGVVPIGHGNDSGGSIRIPASACGLFGLKPTRARNPLGPDFGDMTSGLWAEHVLTRTVRDSAAVLDVTAGAMPGDPYAAPSFPASFLAQVGAPPGRLRIGFSAVAPTGVPVSGDNHEAVRRTAELCESLGHTVEETTLPVDAEAFESAFFVLYAAGAAWGVDSWAKVLGREPENGELERYTAALADLGRRFTASEYLVALQDVQKWARRIADFHASFDVFLTPTLAAAPVPLGHLTGPQDDPLQLLHIDAAFAPFTWMANATGQPAMSMPLHRTAEGLPIGVHFSADLGREDILLRLAAQIEEAHPWVQHRPALS